MIRHQLAFAEPDLDICLNDGFRVRAGDPVETVRYGAKLDASDLRVDRLCAESPRERYRRQRDLSQISSCEFHLFLSLGRSLRPPPSCSCYTQSPTKGHAIRKYTNAYMASQD